MRKNSRWIAVALLPTVVLLMASMLYAAEVVHISPPVRAETNGLATPMDRTTIGQGEAPSGDVSTQPPRIVLDNHQAAGVLGKEIRSATDEKMGRIIDVIVDRGGIVRAAIIDFGGFLGVGSRKIAVDWNALHFAPMGGKSRITLEMTKDQVKAAPEYQEGKPITVLGALKRPSASQLTSAAPER